MHVHHINLLLTHDEPLPRHATAPNASGRFVPVQCRKALIKIMHAIKDHSSFALTESGTFVRFVYNADEENKEEEVADGEESQSPPLPPSSSSAPAIRTFSLICMSVRQSAAIVWVAYPLEAPLSVRMAENRKLEECIFKVDLVRGSSTNLMQVDIAETDIEVSRQVSKFAPACVALDKPWEKILIR